jgi:nucleoside 2-deoxyribosyltransferase
MEQKKKIYIAGAISRLPEMDVLMKFEAAERQVRGAGYEPFNPFLQIGCAPEWQGATWEQLMRTCIIVLMACDGVLLCHDWAVSKGACIERDIAIKVGIPVVYPFEALNF